MIFFLFLFLLICCLSGVGILIACGITGLYLFFFLMTSSYFYLLMESSALLAVLHVYSFRWLFIALLIHGVLKKILLRLLSL